MLIKDMCFIHLPVALQQVEENGLFKVAMVGTKHRVDKVRTEAKVTGHRVAKVIAGHRVDKLRTRHRVAKLRTRHRVVKVRPGQGLSFQQSLSPPNLLKA
jgi:hypothetical protein